MTQTFRIDRCLSVRCKGMADDVSRYTNPITRVGALLDGRRRPNRTTRSPFRKTRHTFLELHEQHCKRSRVERNRVMRSWRVDTHKGGRPHVVPLPTRRNPFGAHPIVSSRRQCRVAPHTHCQARRVLLMQRSLGANALFHTSHVQQHRCNPASSANGRQVTATCRWEISRMDRGNSDPSDRSLLGSRPFSLVRSRPPPSPH